MTGTRLPRPPLACACPDFPPPFTCAAPATQEDLLCDACRDCRLPATGRIGSRPFAHWQPVYAEFDRDGLVRVVSPRLAPEPPRRPGHYTVSLSFHDSGRDSVRHARDALNRALFYERAALRDAVDFRAHLAYRVVPAPRSVGPR